MTRWEYRAYLFEPGDKIVEKLNQFGADGWEVFYFLPLVGDRTRVLFKRPAQTTTGDQK